MSVPTLAQLLELQASIRGAQLAFRFLGDEAEETVDYRTLALRAQSIAAALSAVSEPGDRVLLVFPPGLPFVAAFFGCLWAGRVAVPVYPPRSMAGLEGLSAIALDAQVKVVLTHSALEPMLDALPGRRVCVDALDERAGHGPLAPAPLAFLQYTSGSTGSPRGVMVTHENLFHNLAWLRRRYRCSPASRFVNWLPPYHDMGLIGAILISVFSGASAALLSPLDFIARPLRWLRALSALRGTTSASPNFAFEHAVNRTTPEQRAALDLRAWSFSLNGAEPVRAETLERFGAAFACAGFRKEALHPCYGLAEATLIVSGRPGGALRGPLVREFSGPALEQHDVRPPEGRGDRRLVGCGLPLDDQELVLVDPDTRRRCAPGRVGEVWVRGPSVAAGYWNQPEATARAFGAHLTSGEGPFLRTGDLGFLADGELFVAGRIKDLLIVDGRKHHPQDVEHTVEQSHPAIRPGCVAAFMVPARGDARSLDRGELAFADGPERVAIAAEVDAARAARASFTAPVDGPALRREVERAVHRAVSSRHDVAVDQLMLLSPGELPKTSSGKLRRHQCRERLLSGQWSQESP